MIAVLLGLVVSLPGAAVAQPTTFDLDTVGDKLATTGRYVEFTTNSSIDQAIKDANENGIAFAWLDDDVTSTSTVELWAEDLAIHLADNQAPYQTVIVLTNTGVAAYSTTASESTVNSALDASFDSFAEGAVADGITRFASRMGGPVGSAFWQILFATFGLGAVFVAFRSWRSRRRRQAQAKADLAADRAEVKEQLKANADLIMTLGDEVILSKDPELIDLYDRASRTYQHVSHAIEIADDPAEVDRIDDEMDEAEWQLKVIEARLAGRTPPPSPDEVEAVAKAKAEAERRAQNKPALGPDESILFPTPGYGSNRYPPPTYPYPQRRRGGGFLGGLILGESLGRSRRSERRRSSGWGSGGRSFGSSSRGGSRSFGSSRRGGGGSRSFGSSRRGGGGSRSF